jgi:transcriptional regulator with XRE-family HTH domain
MKNKINNRLRSVRESHDLTAKQVAEKVGTTEVQICRLETGERKLTVDWLLRLCGALDVTADEIVDIPVKGINKTECDPTLLDSAIGFLLEACDRYKVKPNSKDLAKWTTLMYNDAVNLHLNVKQTRGLADTLVRASKTVGK